MHLDPITITILVGAFVLAAGAAIRVAAQRVRVPYTVGMLLIGVAAGLLLRWLHSQGWLHEGFQPLATGNVLSDHLIIFVFLPALVFESAFAMDVYSFSKNLGAVLVLAIPALLVATFATAALMMGLTAGGWAWSFGVALVFGALISATDPVAVVAILRDLGAPKRLSLLIEGESLLNDGTAIVVFTVLVGLLTAGMAASAHGETAATGHGETATHGESTGHETHDEHGGEHADEHGGEHAAAPPAEATGIGQQIGQAVLRFSIVVGGGLLVGLLLAATTSFCLSRIFDDPLVEVTLMIALAYLCMIVAEGLLHVSGVVAVVVAGLWMAGPGRQSISPGAAHTIHRFWEILAYLANTLIFCLVGFIIASQIDASDLTHLWLAPLAWVGIIVIRFGLVFGFRPLINRVGEPVGARESAVIAWGGLRGAVSLALALYVLHVDGVPMDTRTQILRVTALVVLLTVAVNGTTTGWMLRVLGFNRVPPGEQVARLEAHRGVLESVGSSIERLSQEPNLRMHAWEAIREDIDARTATMREKLREAHGELDAASGHEHRVTLWRQALGIERSAVNRAYADGTLGSTAVQIMELEIDFHLDRLTAGLLEPPKARTKGIHEPGLAQWVRKVGMAFNTRAGDLAMAYDVTRAEALSARAVLDGLKVIGGDDGDGHEEAGLDQIRTTYTAWLHDANERLEDLRVNLPEVIGEIENRLARRIELNIERDNYRRLKALGALEEGVIDESLDRIQREMKVLQFARLVATVPKVTDLCRTTPALRGLDEDSLAALTGAITERVVEKDTVLFREGDPGDRMVLIARGAVQIIRGSGASEVVLDVAGSGQLIGEMALLTGEPRNATARALTTVVIGEIDSTSFGQLMSERPQLRQTVVTAFARHGFDNYIRNSADWMHLDHDDVVQWVGDRAPQLVSAGDSLPQPGDGDGGDAGWVFLVSGAVSHEGSHLRAPRLVPAAQAASSQAETECWVLPLGPAPERTKPEGRRKRSTRRITRTTYESRKLTPDDNE